MVPTHRNQREEVFQNLGGGFEINDVSNDSVPQDVADYRSNIVSYI